MRFEKPNLNIRDFILVVPSRLPETACLLLLDGSPRKSPHGLEIHRTKSTATMSASLTHSRPQAIHIGLYQMTDMDVLSWARQPGLRPKRCVGLHEENMGRACRWTGREGTSMGGSPS